MIAVVTMLSLIAAMLEGLALVLIVPLTEAVASESARAGIGGAVGGLLDDTAPRTLIVVGIGCALLASLSRVAATTIQVHHVGLLESAARRRAFAAYLDAELSAQQAERSGRLIEVVSRAHGPVDRLYALMGSMRALASVGLLVLGAIMVQPQAAGAIIVVGLGLFFMFRPIVSRSRAASAAATAAQAEVSQSLAEFEGAHVEVRAFGIASWAKDQFSALVDRLRRARLSQLVLAGVVAPLYQGAVLIGLFTMLAVARSSDAVDLASLGAVALLLLRSLSYGQAFQTAYQGLGAASAVSDWFLRAVERLEGQRESWGPETLGRVRSIELEAVGFRYADGHPVLEAVTCTFTSGDRVGLVGPSGAGKTTLAQVLLRLRSPVEGRYQVNGIPADSYDAASWTSEVAFVPQHPRLIHGTVHENVALFRPGVTRTEVEAAARRAALHEVVAQLPLGYDTAIGASTRSLSGGQIQRLGIARALLCGPSLLVLDEPTSALDRESEAEIQRAIEELPDEVVVVLIAHRMTTLRVCNRIVVLERGQVIADDAPSNVALSSAYFEDLSSSATPPVAKGLTAPPADRR